MQLVVNLSLRDILELSDATVTFVTGAMEAQNISESIVVSLNRCCGYIDYTRSVLMELKVLHAFSVLDTMCKLHVLRRVTGQ